MATPDPKLTLKPVEEPDTLLTALLAVQKELPRISLQKTGKNPAFKSSYLTLDGLHAALLPLLNDFGLLWMTYPTQNEASEPILIYQLVHAATGETRSGSMPLMLDKQNSQGLGSAITYARRYSLCSMTGAVGDPDDDGNAASTSEVTKEVRKVKPEGDRPLSDEERAVVVDAMKGHKEKDLMLRSVGCDDLDHLTVAQGREILTKVKLQQALGSAK